MTKRKDVAAYNDTQIDSEYPPKTPQTRKKIKKDSPNLRGAIVLFYSLQKLYQ